MSFNFSFEQDSIQYDADKAISTLQNQIDADIKKMCDTTDNLIKSLRELQKVAYDIPGTRVSEDYLDFENLIGNVYDGSGILGFLEDVNTLCDQMLDTVEEWKSITRR